MGGMLPAAAAGRLHASRARAAVRRGVQLSHVRAGLPANRSRSCSCPGRSTHDRRPRRSRSNGSHTWSAPRSSWASARSCALIGLPLTPLWFRVFRAFAIGAAIVTMFTIVVVLGRGAYFQSLLRRIDHVLGTSLGEGRVARFIAAVEGQMLDLVRGNPRRLMVLISATAASYLLMALEGWVILRASGAPIAAERCARRRDVFTRLELRLCLHPGKPWGARGVEPRGGHRCWCGGGRRSARARSTPARLVLGWSRTGDLSAPGSGVPRSRRRRRDIEWNAGNAALLSRRAVCVSTGVSEAGGAPHCRARRPRSDPGRLLPRGDLGA